jgi:acyl-CoA hydrolase
MRKSSQYKKPSESETIKTEVVCPNDTNPMGILKGGRLVEWMDMAAAVCAQTHSGKICVTASINDVDFKEAANVGDIITINAKITKAFNTSMEIYVQAFARKVLAGKKLLISEAYFTFVALDEKGKAAKVIAVRPVTATEKSHYDAAERKKEATGFKRKSPGYLYRNNSILALL